RFTILRMIRDTLYSYTTLLRSGGEKMKRLIVIITTLFVVTGLGFFTETTYASPENDLKNKQQKVKDERSEVKKNLSKVDEKLARSEEHTSELQSRFAIAYSLLL